MWKWEFMGRVSRRREKKYIINVKPYNIADL